MTADQQTANPVTDKPKTTTTGDNPNNAGIDDARRQAYGDGQPGAGSPEGKPDPNDYVHVVDRNRFYISQMADKSLPGHGGILFGCGATSLTMALADFEGKSDLFPNGVSHPPTEAEREKVMEWTGVMRAGQFPGGPALMTEYAQKLGLNAKDHSGQTDLGGLDAALKQGHGAIVNGPNHFVYIAGKDANGYIVGDPANPGVTHWDEAHMQSFLANSPVKGWTEVWKGDGNGPRLSMDTGPGNYAPPVVPRTGDGGPVPGGGNGSMWSGEGGNGGSGGGIPNRFQDSPSGANTGRQSSGEGDFYNRVHNNGPNGPGDALNMQNFTDKAVYAISRNEGSFTQINRNDNGAGVSAGIMQWNQQQGQLPQLLEAFYNANPDKFKQYFGDELYKMLSERHLAEFEEAVRHKIDFSDGDYYDKLEKALSDPEYQQVQLDEARKMIVESEQVAYDAGFRSELGMAVVADCINQAGKPRVEEILKDPQFRQVVSQQGERAGIQLLEQRLGRPGGAERDAKLSQSFSFDRPASTTPPAVLASAAPTGPAPRQHG
jgi:hypothetical protein